jgi:hypothetical protein
MSYQNRWLGPVEYMNPINGLSHPFFECIQRGDLATAAEIAAALIEVLKFKQERGEEVSVPLARWETRQEMLNILLDSQK